MSDLHPLELVAVFGGLAAALLALLSPDSRARVAAAWVLLGTVIAAAVVAGPRPEMYTVYLLALALGVAAWTTSRRILAAPVQQVWRSGRGSSAERVTESGGPAATLWRMLAFLAALALLAVPLGLLPLPADVRELLSATGP